MLVQCVLAVTLDITRRTMSYVESCILRKYIFPIIAYPEFVYVGVLEICTGRYSVDIVKVPVTLGV
jgi:hypothetical protein